MIPSISSTKLWSAAIYIRLSKEDYEKGNSESSSVTNQREILKEYVRQHPDIELYDTYIDDGFTGTTFDRPDWKRLMNDIKIGNIDCVIVKDLNRLGRNYTISGDLIDNFFARYNIRFIAINNCIDTMDSGMNAATRCISIGVTNVINESYSAMTSVSIRGTLNNHRRQGKFIGAFPSYGFFKDPEDHHKLIIDENAAAVIRMIYEKFISGRSILGITKDLNSLGIPNPTIYKQQLGWNFHHNVYDNTGKWSDRTVRRILQNEIYIGNMVLGKNRTVSYKVHECRSVPKEEWFVVENTHEPIIDRKTFDTVQSILSRNCRSITGHRSVDLFSGLLFCADCGKPMCKKTNRMSYGTYEYYRCSAKCKFGECSNHTIRRDKLIESLLELFQVMERIVAESNKEFQSSNRSSCKSVLENLIQSKINERNKSEKVKSELYIDWKNGEITHDEYLDFRKRITEKINTLNAEIKEVQMNKAKTNTDKSVELFGSNDKGKGICRLTRAYLVALVDRICIRENNSIIVKVKFDIMNDAKQLNA